MLNKTTEVGSVIISRLSLHIGQILEGCGCGGGVGSIIKKLLSNFVSENLLHIFYKLKK
jgi:hypothetical protein